MKTNMQSAWTHLRANSTQGSERHRKEQRVYTGRHSKERKPHLWPMHGEWSLHYAAQPVSHQTGPTSKRWNKERKSMFGLWLDAFCSPSSAFQHTDNIMVNPIPKWITDRKFCLKIASLMCNDGKNGPLQQLWKEKLEKMITAFIVTHRKQPHYSKLQILRDKDFHNLGSKYEFSFQMQF